MSTTTTYRPVTIDHLDRERWDDHGDLADGQGFEMAAIGLTAAQFEELRSEHPAVAAWERVVDEAMAEIAPQMRDLLIAALERRLPWTWEPDR
jgi:hypothetical protein